MAARFVAALSFVACTLAEPGYYGYGGSYGYLARPYGYGGYADGAPAYHPGGAVSYTARSPQGLRGKREAEADADASYYGGYGSYGYPAYGSYGYGNYGYGARSYEYRSPQGARGLYKREAEADADASYYGGYGYGYPAYGSYGYGNYGYGARSYAYTRRGYGKRSAEAEPSYGYAGSYQSVNRALPYGGISSYSVRDNVYSAAVSDRRRTPAAAYGYGFSAY